jgi:hypothetical protein
MFKILRKAVLARWKKKSVTSLTGLHEMQSNREWAICSYKTT